MTNAQLKKLDRLLHHLEARGVEVASIAVEEGGFRLDLAPKVSIESGKELDFSDMSR